MVKTFKSLVAAGAAAVLALGYEGYASQALRQLQDSTPTLVVRNGRELGLPRYCKGISGDPNVKDRFCEESAVKTDSRCECQEVCQIWGDPHVEPFFSGCSVITMDDGAYTIFQVPNQIEIRGWMENKFVRKIYIALNGETIDMNTDDHLVYNSLDCVNSMSGYVDSYPLTADNGDAVTLDFATHCDTPGKSTTFHLNTTIITHDGCGHDTEDDDDDDDDDDDNVGDSSSDMVNAAEEKYNTLIANEAECNPRNGAGAEACERKAVGCLYNEDTQVCHGPGVSGIDPTGYPVSTTCFDLAKKDCNTAAKSFECIWVTDKTNGNYCTDYRCSMLNKNNCKKAYNAGLCDSYDSSTKTCPDLLVPAGTDSGSSTVHPCTLLGKNDCKQAESDGTCDRYNNQCFEANSEPECALLTSKKACNAAGSRCIYQSKKCVDASSGSSQYGEVPTSTTYWASSSGACRNPCSQESMQAPQLTDDPTDVSKASVATNAIDKRGSSECGSKTKFWEVPFGTGKCKEREGSWDGAKLSCNSECSAYGDPYVTPLFTDMPDTRGCDVGKNCFNVFLSEGDSEEMYVLPGVFSSLIETDDCEFITKFTARYAVNADGDYYEQVFNADEYCGTDFNGLISADSRTVVEAPGKRVDGSINTAGMTQTQIDNLAIANAVYNADVDGFHLGVLQDSSIGELDAGGIKVILKCHNTLAKKNRPSTAYFNVCIHRNGVEPAGGTTDTSVNIDLQTLEADMESRGHCALGEYKKKTGNYEFRESTQINTATWPADGQAPLDPPNLNEQ